MFFFLHTFGCMCISNGLAALFFFAHKLKKKQRKLNGLKKMPVQPKVSIIMVID